VISGDAIQSARLREIVEKQRGMREAFTALENDPALTPLTLGIAHKNALGADWSEATTTSVGKFIRGWARACGIVTQIRGNYGAGQSVAGKPSVLSGEKIVLF
jgi:hypothetical protein